MRRADERRSASVMISSSIRWSLAGNDVDWMMKTSEPRTFSWISTKISMSAKRRTTALVSGSCSQSAIACASAGLELPATSLMEPFLADIEASPRALLETMFSISGYPRNRRVSTSEVISRRWRGWQPVGSRFSCAKIGSPGDYLPLTGGCSSSALTRNSPEAGEAASALATAGPRLPGAGAGGGASAGAVPLIMAAEAAEAGLRDLAATPDRRRRSRGRARPCRPVPRRTAAARAAGRGHRRPRPRRSWCGRG